MSTDSEELDGETDWSGFPGGHARLPRLSHPKSRSGEPEVAYLKKSVRRAKKVEEPVETTASGFEQYYSSNSLFNHTQPQADAPDADGPYAVLGLASSATWEEVSKAHRELVSQLHPDRFIDADDDVRAGAEDLVRDVNEAFATIRREHATR